MRHGSNARRSRGRNNNGHNNNHNNHNNNRRANPKMQTFDSNGPDVRIRGNAYQITEKYIALARDASSAGDNTLAESYYQHAEHYQRMINEFQETIDQRQSQPHSDNRQPSSSDTGDKQTNETTGDAGGMAETLPPVKEGLVSDDKKHMVTADEADDDGLKRVVQPKRNVRAKKPETIDA